MSRDYKVLLCDVLDAIGAIRKYTAGFTLPTFAEDAKTRDAVIRNLEVIGEAVKKVPENVRAAHPAVDWKKIAGMRDILIHQYFGIDAEILWDIVENKLPVLEKQIEGILNE